MNNQHIKCIVMRNTLTSGDIIIYRNIPCKLKKVIYRNKTHFHCHIDGHNILTGDEIYGEVGEPVAIPKIICNKYLFADISDNIVTVFTKNNKIKTFNFCCNKSISRNLIEIFTRRELFFSLDLPLDLNIIISNYIIINPETENTSADEIELTIIECMDRESIIEYKILKKYRN